MAKLYIAIYKARGGNYKHWALFLLSGSETTVYEVSGEHGTFAKNTIQTNPGNSNRHERNIQVATINDSEIPDFKKVVREANVDNETVEWNCQDYVIEILEELHKECIIDDEDEHYEKGVRLAKKNHYGPL